MPSQLSDSWRSYLPNACASLVRPAVPIDWNGRTFPFPLPTHVPIDWNGRTFPLPASDARSN